MDRVYLNLYLEFLKRFLKLKKPIKAVFDCSNGTTGLILNRIMNNESGVKDKVKNSIIRNSKFIILNKRPDGRFPAHGPNPLIKGATRQLEREVKKQKADLGVIFDADGDRVFFTDNRGKFIDSNETGYMLMQMHKPPYVTGIVSSWRLKKCQVSGVRCQMYISRVGHYFFKKLMREKKASLGLEHSGHYYFKDFFYCDSGIFAAIKVINFVSGLKTDLASWLDKLPGYYRSGEINFEVEDKEEILKRIEKRYKKSAEKIDKMDGLTAEFGNWWFNLRPSNTEPLLRLNIEVKSQEILKGKLKEIKNLIITA
ncbi:MAG: hypothetical protein HZB99_03590 [Candidatus Harrisonbacteria bacterium]|nr:hypothetical protein [Candidatus Harrisonbacteria bacterium]